MSIARRFALQLSRCAGCLLVAVLFLTPAIAEAQVRNITAVWDANTDGITAGYHVLVGMAPQQPLVVLDVARATSIALPLPIGSRYYVAVRAYTATGVHGSPTAETVVDLVSAPGAPAGLRADVNGPNVTLRWSESATGGVPSDFVLFVGTAPGVANLVGGASLGNVASVSGDLPPGTYYAQLHALNVVGVSPSAQTSFQVSGGFRPLAPSNLRQAWNGTTVVLSWAAPSGDPASLPTSYIIEAGAASGLANVGALNVGLTTTFAVEVPPGTFYVRVRGVNDRGVSDASNEVVIRR